MSKNNVVSLKLWIDAKRQSVLFAEASGTLTDVLSDMLSQPVGGVVSVLRQQEMAAGCLAKLCKSIETIKLNFTPAANTKGVYVCSLQCKRYDVYGQSRVRYSDDPSAICPACFRRMTNQLEYVAPPPKAAAPSEGGSGVAVNYLIKDDLEVMPLSTISIVTQLNKFGVKDVAALEERVVQLGLHEAIKLLTTCLQSKKALTDAFLTGGTAKPNPKRRVKRERCVGDHVVHLV